MANSGNSSTFKAFNSENKIQAHSNPWRRSPTDYANVKTRTACHQSVISLSSVCHQSVISLSSVCHQSVISLSSLTNDDIEDAEDVPPETRTPSSLTASVLMMALCPDRFCRKSPFGNFHCLMLSGDADAIEYLHRQNCFIILLFIATWIQSFSVSILEPTGHFIKQQFFIINDFLNLYDTQTKIMISLMYRCTLYISIAKHRF